MPEINEHHSVGSMTETVVKGKLTAEIGVDNLKKKTKLVSGLLGVSL
jgi:hypothetical protein